ncbi:amidophosphoribosyltransferase [Bdellovibrio sp. HCB337]|uniref:amidophosphoribosyltransferase n=1 Tax=Bdellovibrio sp. HCB337 TaxID=3394358 RepID=UPI0039A6EA66
MCGVIGLIGTNQASSRALRGLSLLQHRGQDAAGILSYDDSGFHYVRNLGLVENVFTAENMRPLTGEMAIGHVRYGTAGKSELRNVQPFLLNFPYGIGMVHNGNLVNFRSLTQELRVKYQRQPLADSDTENIINLFAEGLAKNVQRRTPNFEDLCAAVSFVIEKAIGSYSIVTMVAGYGLVAFKDPYGLRPLVMGSRQEDSGKMSYAFASESTALSFLGYDQFEEVRPGEMVAVSLDGNIERKIIRQQEHRPCMFEWVYFASPTSEIEGSPVYKARIELGKKMAAKVIERMNKDQIGFDVVVPVPETARIAAIALAEELKVPYREVLIKNRYITRTFILDSQDKREQAVHLKLAPVYSEIKGKRVLLVDDSIVRGTTSRKLIELVRMAGAKEVYFASTCPPIKHPCYYGIDFPMENELLANNKSLEKVEEELGADGVIYQEIESLQEALFVDRKVTPCMACLTGKYPTATEGVKELAKTRNEDRSAFK